MPGFATQPLPERPDEIAPDGSEVRVLQRLAGGSMIEFRMPAGRTSRAVAHRAVEEVWYVVEGRAELWRKLERQEEIVELRPGMCVTLPRGTHFQFRVTADLIVVAVTMPPWPGNDEAYGVAGPWKASG